MSGKLLSLFTIIIVFVSGVLLKLAGVGNFVTSACCTLGVFMELAANHGSATASLNGEGGFVIKVTRALDLKLSFAEDLGLPLPSYLSLLYHSDSYMKRQS